MWKQVLVSKLPRHLAPVIHREVTDCQLDDYPTDEDAALATACEACVIAEPAAEGPN